MVIGCIVVEQGIDTLKQEPFSCRQWPLQQHCVLGFVEPVVAVQKIQVPRGVVDSHDSGDLEKILRVEACATLCGRKFDPAVVLPLKLFLMGDEEAQVTNIIQDQGIVEVSFELHHLCWEDLSVTNFELQGPGETETSSWQIQSCPKRMAQEWWARDIEGNLSWKRATMRWPAVLLEMAGRQQGCCECVWRRHRSQIAPLASLSRFCKHPGCACAPARHPWRGTSIFHTLNHPACNASKELPATCLALCKWHCHSQWPMLACSCLQRNPGQSHPARCQSCWHKRRKSHGQCSLEDCGGPRPLASSHVSLHLGGCHQSEMLHWSGSWNDEIEASSVRVSDRFCRFPRSHTNTWHAKFSAASWHSPWTAANATYPARTGMFNRQALEPAPARWWPTARIFFHKSFFPGCLGTTQFLHLVLGCAFAPDLS